jgi:hypothetical protein
MAKLETKDEKAWDWAFSQLDQKRGSIFTVPALTQFLSSLKLDFGVWEPRDVAVRMILEADSDGDGM